MTGEDDDYRSLAAANKRWQEQYGHLTPAERAIKIKQELAQGLANLEAAGIVPSMSAEELMQLTRGDD